MSASVTATPLVPPRQWAAGRGVMAGVEMLLVVVLPGTTSGMVAAPSMRHVGSTIWFTASLERPLDGPEADSGHAVAIASSRSNAEMLEHVRSLSGFTWDQIARLFNVSRRSVHLWLAGGRMSAGNEERLVQLVQLVEGLPAATPEQRRYLLLRPSDGGRSAFDSFRLGVASADTDINRNLEPLADSDDADVSGAG